MSGVFARLDERLLAERAAGRPRRIMVGSTTIGRQLAEHEGMTQHDDWRELGQQLRVDSVRSSSAAGSGHPTSSMSAADLMAVLLSNYLHYDFDRPEDPRNDHLIFSKGHASPLLYAMYKAAGAITDDEMLTFRRFGSRIEGHPRARCGRHSRRRLTTAWTT
jgi:transketolase N-terminal domain/subunit